jgi:ABC-2 type transport system ATP-binding protein
MQSVIELHKATKLYGSAIGVRDVTLSVQTGSVFGFLGPNGSGKTTTISMMMNLTKPTAGQIKLFGLDNQSKGLAIRQRIGFLASDMALDRGFTGWQQLEYFGNLRGTFDKKHIRELAERLDCKLNKKFKTLSRGNKQKIGLIAALMHHPELLILDEPTSGLDPLIQAEFNKIILEHKKAGGSVFISSHVLSEVQELCDHVAFIRSGRLVASKPLEEITANAPKIVRIISDDAVLRRKLQILTGVEELQLNPSSLRFTYGGRIDVLLALVLKHKIIDMTIQDADLEAVFMKYYETDTEKPNA